MHADTQATRTHIHNIPHSLTRDAQHVAGSLTRPTRSLPDVSVWLKSYLTSYMKSNEKSLGEVNCRIINPSYMIRSVPPHVEDRQYCGLLAIHAVHGACSRCEVGLSLTPLLAAMAGYTGVTIGLVNNHYVCVSLLAFAPHAMC